MEGLSGLNALVTGGAGFIGSNLVEELSKLNLGRLVAVDNMSLRRLGGEQRGLDILADISRENLRVVEADASDLESVHRILREEEIDVVFDLAILPLPFALEEPKLAFENNVKIASTLAELLRRDAYRTLVHFSSSEVYGSAVRVPMDEDHPLMPSTAYGASKAAQDLLLLSYFHTYAVDVRIIRPFNNIGKAQNDFSYSAVVPSTIRRILSGKPPEIYGDGLQTRDFIYVKDTCKAAMKVAVMERMKGEVVNIGSGMETRILDLVKKICDLMGYRNGIVFKPPRPGDVRRHFADITKARRMLGFEPETPLEKSLEETIRWYSARVGVR